MPIVFAKRKNEKDGDSLNLFETSISARCKNDCIDKFFYFCPSADGTSGSCCDSEASCSRHQQEDFDTGYSGSYCSFDSSDDSIALKYWACPRNQDLCGEQTLLVSDAQESKIASNPAYEGEMTNGTICGYQIAFPWGAGEYDRLLIRIDAARNVSVYITEATSYFDRDIFEYRLEEGGFVSVTHPSTAFITVVSASADPGSFKIGYSYEDREASEKVARVKLDAVTVVEEERAGPIAFIRSTDFFVLVLVVSVLVSLLLLGSFLCCVLRRHLRRRRNRIVIINDNKDQKDKSFGRDAGFTRSETAGLGPTASLATVDQPSSRPLVTSGVDGQQTARQDDEPDSQGKHPGLGAQTAASSLNDRALDSMLYGPGRGKEASAGSPRVRAGSLEQDQLQLQSVDPSPLPRIDTDRPLAKDNDYNKFAGVDEYLGTLGSEVELGRSSSRNAGLWRDTSRATIDPRQEGSRQDSYAAIEVASLEGPTANGHGSASKEEVMPRVNGLGQNKRNNEYRLFEHTSTFIPITDNGEAFEK